MRYLSRGPTIFRQRILSPQPRKSKLCDEGSAEKALDAQKLSAAI